MSSTEDIKTDRMKNLSKTRHFKISFFIERSMGLKHNENHNLHFAYIYLFHLAKL